MFDSLRDKLQTVQDGITASLRGLSKPELRQRSRNAERAAAVNVNAGADLLLKYQTEWAELHSQAEENADQAQVVDELVGNLHQRMVRQHCTALALNNGLSSIPILVSKMDKLIKEIDFVGQLAETVELSLLQLEDTVEMQHLQEQQLEARFELAMHREKRLSQLDNVRAELSTNHANKLLRHEVKVGARLKERQAAFSEAFQSDLERYKELGTVPRAESSTQGGPSLKDIEIESDGNALNQLLDS